MGYISGMDCKQIQEHLQKWLYEKSNIYQALNFSKAGLYESDVLAITKSLMITEIEVKISRSDFKADFKKTHKHYRMQNPITDGWRWTPNKFYFACPVGLINDSDVPTYAGLIWVDSLGNIEVVKEAKRLHRIKAPVRILTAMLHHLTAKSAFGCQYMTYQNRQSQALFDSTTNPGNN